MSTTGAFHRGSSVLEINDKEVIDYEWDFLIPPKSRVQENIAAVSGNGFSFPDLKFNSGFLSDVDHHWGVSIYANQINVYISLPARTFNCAFTVNRSKILLLSKNEVDSTHKLLFKKDDFSHPAKHVTWAAFWANSTTGAWTESIDTIRVVLTIGMETSGKCIKNVEFNTSGVWVDEEHKDSFNASIFFDSPKFSDVTISCGDRTFHAHKFLLICRSRVFESMFQSNMKESVEGHVLIEDMDANILEEMLRYMYTGTVYNIQDSCEELLMAAEKYELVNLKGKCESILAGKLTTSNAMEIYTLAEVHRAPSLMIKAIDVLKSNKRQIITEAETFKRFSQIYPELMFELFKL